MANQQEPEENVDQLRLVLNLSHSTRSQLINSLNDLSAILQCYEPIPEDAKQRTCTKIEETILLLVNLSPFEPTQSSCSADVFEKRISGQLIVQLPKAERSSIVAHLSDIKDVVLHDDKISREAKDSLVAENKRIIDKLLSLSRKDKNENGDEPTSKKQRIEPGPNEDLGRLKAIIGKQEGQLSTLETRLEALRRQIKCVTSTRAEVSFRFDLTDVSKFFDENDGANEYCSDSFWCRGLEWSVVVERHTGSCRQVYLIFFLRFHDDNTQKLSCQVEYDFVLFSNLSRRQNKVLKSTRNLATNQFGMVNCISYSELTDPKNGFMKNDTIRLGVELKVGQIVRWGDGSKIVEIGG